MRAVVMFHAVDPCRSVLSITEQDLRSLLMAILRSGHDILPLRSLLAEDCSTEKGIALSFDDGAHSLINPAATILKDLGATASLFLTTGTLGGINNWRSQPASAPTFAMLSWDDVETLHSLGWSIEAHTVSHADLRTLSDSALEEELTTPIDQIQSRIGHRPQILAYPYGYHNARVVQHASMHYSHAVTTAFRPLRSGEDPHRIPRLDSYYLQSHFVHRHFGDTLFFPFYLNIVSQLRQLRRHPGELE